MAGRGNCRRTVADSSNRAQENTTERREEQEMPMCRHVHLSSNSTGSTMERQLCGIQQLMCEQNRMLGELLQMVRERNG